jgi:hypothetical protein
MVKFARKMIEEGGSLKKAITLDENMYTQHCYRTEQSTGRSYAMHQGNEYGYGDIDGNEITRKAHNVMRRYDIVATKAKYSIQCGVALFY